jgi:hypothetical protein
MTAELGRIREEATVTQQTYNPCIYLQSGLKDGRTGKD